MDNMVIKINEEENIHFYAKEEDVKNQPEVAVTTSGSGQLTVSFKEGQTEESTQSILEKVLSNPAVKDQALTNATYILNKLNNWFTIDQLIKKTNFNDKRVAQDILDLLCLFGLAYRDVKEGNLLKYKITLSKEDKKKLLQDEIKETEEKLQYLIKQLNELS